MVAAQLQALRHVHRITEDLVQGALDGAQKNGAPKWNFHKYVVGKDGQVTASFPSAVKPDREELKNASEAALKL